MKKNQILIMKLPRRKILLKKVIFVPISCRNAFNMVAISMRGSMTFGPVQHDQHGIKTLTTTMRGYRQFIFLECLKEY